MENFEKSIIAAPAGTQGVFEILGNNGDELYLDVVVALAIIHDKEDLLDGKNLISAPMGIGLDGSVALALVAASGVVYDGNGSWPSLRRWLDQHAAGRPFMRDQFGDALGTIPE